jgi:hypothetical protein
MAALAGRNFGSVYLINTQQIVAFVKYYIQPQRCSVRNSTPLYSQASRVAYHSPPPIAEFFSAIQPSRRNIRKTFPPIIITIHPPRRHTLPAGVRAAPRVRRTKNEETHRK